MVSGPIAIAFKSPLKLSFSVIICPLSLLLIFLGVLERIRRKTIEQYLEVDSRNSYKLLIYVDNRARNGNENTVSNARSILPDSKRKMPLNTVHELGQNLENPSTLLAKKFNIQAVVIIDAKT